MVKWSLDSLSKTVLPMTVFALYEVKSVPFIWVFEYVKVLPCSCLPDMFQPFMKSFKWGTTCTSILRSIRNTCSQTFGCPISLNKMGLFWILWLVVILMPFHRVVFISKSACTFIHSYLQIGRDNSYSSVPTDGTWQCFNLHEVCK